MNKIKLSNGVEMPQLGYGVYQVSPDECERCVLDALSVGYRMIDTAQAYHNEEAVGSAWKKSGVNRDELFLVSKVWISNYGEGQTMKSIDESLRKLQTDHKERMEENLNLFDFELDADDMQTIATLDTAHSLFFDHHDGQMAKNFMEWRSLVKPAK